MNASLFVIHRDFKSDTSFAGRGAGIYTVNADGSGLTQLVSVQDPLGNPAFSPGNLAGSPDGAHIAYKAGSTLYVINADGSGQATPLLAIHDPNCTSLVSLSSVWLADGKRIAYSISNEGNLEIHIVQIDGSGDLNATNNPAEDNFTYPIASGGC